MSEFTINEMKEMQKSLQEKYQGQWEITLDGRRSRRSN